MLSWFDAEGNRYPSAEEKALEFEVQAQVYQTQAQAYQTQAQAYQTQAQQERQARLAAIMPLQNMGLTPAQIAEALQLSLDVVEASLGQIDPD